MSRGMVAGLLALTVLRLVVATFVPLSPDEAYYWVWSRVLQAGYLDHPPMVALWIRVGTMLAGQTALGVRLLGPVSALVGSLALWRAGRDLGLEARQAGRAVWVLNATLLFGAGSLTMTPDTPLLFFWTLGLWALARLVAGAAGWWWLVAGAAVGLGMDSKYTAIFLPLGVVLWLVLARGGWRRLAQVYPWAGGVLAGGLFAPVVWWNWRHHWASFAKQGGRNADFHWAGAGQHLAELLGGQVGLATPLIFMLLVAGVAALWRPAWRERAEAPVLLLCLTLPALLVFVEHAVGDRVQANWPCILYPGAAIAAAAVLPRLFVPAVALGGAVTAFAYIQGATGVLKLGPRLDPTLRLAGGFAGLAAQVDAAADRQQAGFVAADEYGTASLLAFHGRGCGHVVAVEPRWALFDLPPAGPWLAGKAGLLVRSAKRRSAPDPADFAQLEPVGSAVRARGGAVAEQYALFRGVLREGSVAAVLLPCRGGAATPPG